MFDEVFHFYKRNANEKKTNMNVLKVIYHNVTAPYFSRLSQWLCASCKNKQLDGKMKTNNGGKEKHRATSILQLWQQHRQ